VPAASRTSERRSRLTPRVWQAGPPPAARAPGAPSPSQAAKADSEAQLEVAVDETHGRPAARRRSGCSVSVRTRRGPGCLARAPPRRRGRRASGLLADAGNAPRLAMATRRVRASSPLLRVPNSACRGSLRVKIGPRLRRPGVNRLARAVRIHRFSHRSTPPQPTPLTSTNVPDAV
jgi:hypothetical protein